MKTSDIFYVLGIVFLVAILGIIVGISESKRNIGFTVEYSVFVEGQKRCSQAQQALNAIKYKQDTVYAICSSDTVIELKDVKIR